MEVPRTRVFLIAKECRYPVPKSTGIELGLTGADDAPILSLMTPRCKKNHLDFLAECLPGPEVITGFGLEFPNDYPGDLTDGKYHLFSGEVYLADHLVTLNGHVSETTLRVEAILPLDESGRPDPPIGPTEASPTFRAFFEWVEGTLFENTSLLHKWMSHAAATEALIAFLDGQSGVIDRKEYSSLLENVRISEGDLWEVLKNDAFSWLGDLKVCEAKAATAGGEKP